MSVRRLFSLHAVRYAIACCIFLWSCIVNAQVDLSSGRAQARLPLYSYSDGDKLNTGVSLEYTDGSGIKVNEVAAAVGLGWSLDAGGFVTRLTRGEPDDQKGGVLDGGELYATGNLYTPYYGRHVVPRGFGWTPLDIGSSGFYKHSEEVIADRVQDEFVFRFAGRSGRFVIDRKGICHTLDDSKLRIEKVEEDMSAGGILTRISKFIITDETGTKYTFSEKELGKIITSDVSGKRRANLTYNPGLAVYITVQRNKVSNYYAVNSWQLTEIKTPGADKTITFTYDSYNVDYVSDIDAGETQYSGNSGDERINLKAESRIVSTLKRITGITLPDNTNIKFAYTAANRVDLPGTKALDKVVIERNGIASITYQFNYQYFSRNNLRDYTYTFPAGELPNARLCLKSIQKKGIDNLAENPFLFTYFIEGNGIPGRLMGMSDHWGYNKGDLENWDNDDNIVKNTASIAVGANRNVGSALLIRQGLLKSIQYPGGGSLNYEYENNTAKVGASTMSTAGVRVKRITYKDGVSASPDVVKEYDYTLEDGTSSGWGYQIPDYGYTTKTTMVIPTKGTYVTSSLASDLASSVIPDIGKLRIPATGRPVDKLTQFKAAGMVYGMLLTLFYYALADVVFPDKVTKDVINTGNSSLSANRLNPLPDNYSRVIEYEGTTTANRGKTVFEFTTDNDFSIVFPGDPYAGKDRYINSLYGMLKKKKVYNSNNELLNEEYNKYDFIGKQLDNSDNYSVIFNVERSLATTRQWLDASKDALIITFTDIYPLVGRPQLRYKLQRNYSGGTDFTELRTDYTYDDNYNLKKEITLNSSNEKIEKRIYYPYDYNIPGVLTKLNNDSVLSIPVSTETWQIADGKEDRLLAMEVSDLKVLNNGTVKPDKVYRLFSKTPVLKSVIGEFNPAKLIRDNNLIIPQEQFVYDDRGNISESLLNGRMESNIYDDLGEMIIAKVRNGAPSDIAYSSFEKQAKGNWKITPVGTGDYITDQARITGNSCLNLAAVSLVEKTGLSIDKKYFLSFWSRGGAVTVTGGTRQNETNAATRNGWTLTTMNITAATTITIKGTGYIDELRLLPVDAAMVTQTYDDARNISSATDAFNMVTYYEYDGLGRAKYLRDADNNIIRAYEFSYKL